MTRNITCHRPQKYGWIEVKLEKEDMDHLWDCVNNADCGDFKHTLVGQVEKSREIKDIDDKFFNDVLSDLIKTYGTEFDHDWYGNPVNLQELNVKPCLQSMWVNYQNAGEYNPMHDHGGLYSFAIWMKNPEEYSVQTVKKNSRGASSSFNNAFAFQYNNLFGKIETTMYPMGKRAEGTMVFFPAKLQHGVYPFYDSDEQRISISGNIILEPAQFVNVLQEPSNPDESLQEAIRSNADKELLMRLSQNDT